MAMARTAGLLLLLLTAYTVPCNFAGMAKGRRVGWDAESVRGLRRHMALTQEELAELLGVRQQTVSEWETGVYSPRGASGTLLQMVAERAGFAYDSGGAKGAEGEGAERADGGAP
jgi:hypothetical protein